LGGDTAPEITQRKQGALPTKSTTERRVFNQKGIAGPAYVIRGAVINARQWEEVVSSDGVVSYVSRIGQRALREEPSWQD
jgi:hypothetical protein